MCEIQRALAGPKVLDMVDALPLRIFLASPGDVQDERKAVLVAVDEFNRRRAGDSGVAFEVVGWEQVRGTARRPQEAINELISESHFVVILFKQSWGSEPGSPWGYTSGTEEELFTGLLELGQIEQPMRDLWVAFIGHSNPDENIVTLRDQMSRHPSLMYETISDVQDLKIKLGERLLAWSKLTGTKVPRHVDLVPSSGKDVLRAANLRIRGEKLVSLGQADAGQKALSDAAILGGPVEQLAHATFQARHGDLDGAYKSTQNAIDYFSDGTHDLFSPQAAEAFAAQAGVLRRQARDVDAIGRLQQALTLLDDAGQSAVSVRSRILDQLGLSHQKTNDLSSARENFEASLELREKSGDLIGRCQSLTNLARLEVADNNLETAVKYAEEVIEKLRNTPPTSLHANVEVLVAQVRIRQSRPNEGVPNADRALAINRQIANKLGEAISLYVLAECKFFAGDHPNAREYVKASHELNLEMKNSDGVKRSEWLRKQLEI